VTDRNRDIADLDDEDQYADPGTSNSPRATHGVYQTFVTASYIVETTEYNIDIRVAPEEPT
jgi:hypothetical protein